MGEFYKHPTRAREYSSFRQVFPAVFAAAQARGEMPGDLDPVDVADMLNASMVSAVEGWVSGAHSALGPVLQHRARVLLAGVRAEHAPTE